MSNITEQDLSALKAFVSLWREMQDRYPWAKKNGVKLEEYMEWLEGYRLEAQGQSGQKMCDLLYCCHGSKPAGHAQPTETDGSSDKTLNPHKTSERVRLVPAEPAQHVSFDRELGDLIFRIASQIRYDVANDGVPSETTLVEAKRQLLTLFQPTQSEAPSSEPESFCGWCFKWSCDCRGDDVCECSHTRFGHEVGRGACTVLRGEPNTFCGCSKFKPSTPVAESDGELREQIGTWVNIIYWHGFNMKATPGTTNPYSEDEYTDAIVELFAAHSKSERIDELKRMRFEAEVTQLGVLYIEDRIRELEAQEQSVCPYCGLKGSNAYAGGHNCIPPAETDGSDKPTESDEKVCSCGHGYDDHVHDLTEPCRECHCKVFTKHPWYKASKPTETDVVEVDNVYTDEDGRWSLDGINWREPKNRKLAETDGTDLPLDGLMVTVTLKNPDGYRTYRTVTPIEDTPELLQLCLAEFAVSWKRDRAYLAQLEAEKERDGKNN